MGFPKQSRESKGPNAVPSSGKKKHCQETCLCAEQLFKQGFLQIPEELSGIKGKAQALSEEQFVELTFYE